jgi:PAS domain-containing protein
MKEQKTIARTDKQEVERRTGKSYSLDRGAFADRLWEESFIYIKTVINTVTQPFVFLDKDFKVIAANESYYETFEEDRENVEGLYFYEIGEGIWEIPELKGLLLDVTLHDGHFKGFEVTRKFPRVGKKVLVLSARKIYREIGDKKVPSDIILLAMEDATELMRVAEIVVKHANDLKLKVPERRVDIQKMIDELEHEIRETE